MLYASQDTIQHLALGWNFTEYENNEYEFWTLRFPALQSVHFTGRVYFGDFTLPVQDHKAYFFLAHPHAQFICDTQSGLIGLSKFTFVETGGKVTFRTLTTIPEMLENLLMRPHRGPLDNRHLLRSLDLYYNNNRPHAILKEYGMTFKTFAKTFDVPIFPALEDLSHSMDYHTQSITIYSFV